MSQLLDPKKIDFMMDAFKNDPAMTRGKFLKKYPDLGYTKSTVDKYLFLYRNNKLKPNNKDISKNAFCSCTTLWSCAYQELKDDPIAAINNFFLALHALSKGLTMEMIRIRKQTINSRGEMQWKEIVEIRQR